MSAVEKLQRAFARESTQNRDRDTRYRHFRDHNSSDNDQSDNISDDSSDDENTAALFHQQSRNTQESCNANEAQEQRNSHSDINRPSGSKSKNSARHVSAEVHVAPLDDKNVEVHENEESNLLRENNLNTNGDSNRSHINELSDNNQTTSQLSHIVEIHADEQEMQSNDVNEGNA